MALATNSDTSIRLVPVLPAVMLALNALLITRLPDAADDVEARAPSRRWTTRPSGRARCATAATSR